MPLSKSCPKKKKDCHQFGNLNAGQKARAGRMPKTRSEKQPRKQRMAKMFGIEPPGQINKQKENTHT